MGKKIENIDIQLAIRFWDWFSDHCNNFGDEFQNEELLEELDKQISLLGNYSWEVGPGLNASNLLVISPSGDPELLSQTRQIISLAKDCEDWEFYYAKPPKKWVPVFDFQKEDGAIIQLDASLWKYGLLKYDDGMYEIIIEAANTKSLNKDEQIMAAEIVLDGILGEEERIVTICAIEVTTAFENEYSKKSTSITDLQNHIKDIHRS